MKKYLTPVFILFLIVISVIPVMASSRKITETTPLTVGETIKLRIKGVRQKRIKWSSSRKSVVTVSRNGVVKANKAGAATITARYHGEKTKFKIIVTPAPIEYKMPQTESPRSIAMPY